MQTSANQLEDQEWDSQQNSGNFLSINVPSRQKLSMQTQNLVLQAKINFIEDLNKEINVQKKQLENDVKFREENEQDNVLIQRQIDQLRVRVEQTRIIVNSKRRDPYKVQKLITLKESQANAEKNLREEIIDIKAALVVQERIHMELNEKLQRYLEDLEQKVSLETKIQTTLESIEKLKLQLEKLYRLQAKLRKGGTERITISETLTTISSILILMNAYERQTIYLENQYLETGVKLYITLDQSRKLVSRNNLVADKLPLTLGTLKDEYILGILERWQSMDLKQNEDTEIEFSKMSVAYFFRIFMVEVKIQEIINYLEQEVKDYEKHRELLQDQGKKIISIEFEQVQIQDIEEGNNLNKIVKARMEHFQKLIIEYTDVNELQKSGVDRFQGKIRVKCVSEVKERTRLSDILSKDGLQRAHRIVDILSKYYHDVEKVMKIKWLNHHTDFFMGFRRNVMDLTSENNDLTANFHILKLVLDKIKNSQKQIDKADIQKADKIIRKLNKFLDSVNKDHVTLVDIERRLKDLDVEYEKLKKIVFEEAKKQVEEGLKHRDTQSSDLNKKERDLDAYLNNKKAEFDLIKNDIDDNDIDVLTKLLVFEGQLIDACQDGELAHEQQTQIQQKIDRLRRQYQNIGTVDMAQLDDAFEIIDILSGLEIHIVGTEQIIDQAYKKIKDFEQNIKDILKSIRNKRKIDCDRSISVTFGQLDKLIKLIDKYNNEIEVIKKDQENMKKTGMKDQEKDRDAFQFDQRILDRMDQLKESGKKRDEFKILLDAYKKSYDSKKDLTDSDTGSEFQRLQVDSDSLKASVEREIQNLEGFVYFDILATKADSQALQNKHKYKQEKHEICMDLRAKKNEDFKGWTAHLKSMKARQQKLEDLLKGIQFSREHQQAYDKFRNRLDQNELVVKRADDQTDSNAKILYSEAADLDLLQEQVVKTQKIEDIHQMLEALKFLTDTFNDDIENYDADLTQLEKDINDYLNKLKASSYQDCQNLLDKLDNSLEKLNNKLKEVDGDFDTVYGEFNPIKDKLKNKDTIQNQLDNLGNDQNGIKGKRDKFAAQIKAMKDKFAKIDPKNVSVKDCENILQEGGLLDVQINDEYDKDVEVQDKLKKLLMRLRNAGKDEEEKQRLLAKLKSLLNDNRDLLKLMKQHIDNADLKANDFEKLYKSMVDSEDYEARKPNNQKKLVKVRGIKGETEKYTGLRSDAEKQMDKFTDAYINGLQDLDDLEDAIKDQTKLNDALKGYVKILGDIVKGLDRRRLKTQDAEVRKNANKHQKLHDDIQEIAKKTQANLDQISIQIKTVDKAKVESLEKQHAEFQGRLNSFRTKFDKISALLKALVDEIKPKDLEATETVGKLAEYIDRLRGIGQALKELKGEIDKLYAEVDDLLTSLSSLGAEKALRDLINRLLDAQKNNQEIIDHIKRMIALTDSYDGYTTGAEDGKFYSGLNARSKKLLQELKDQDAQFTKTIGDIEKIIGVVKNDPKTGDPVKDNALQEKRKGEINQIKGLVDKLIDAKIKIDDEAIGNKKKMSDYILEDKIGRRKEEIDELERQHEDYAAQIAGGKLKAEEEIATNAAVAGQKANVEKLQKCLAELAPLEEKMTEMVAKIQELQVQCSELGENTQNIPQDQNIVEMRLNYYDEHLILKKKIRDLKKELQDLWNRVQAWITQLTTLLGQEPAKVAVKLAFKATDDIDKMLGEILARLGIPVPISKIGGGYYMFGSKKIFCKIINGKLVVRVGGGYMGIEEFIITYGKNEVDKAGLIKNLEDQVKNSGSSGFSAASMVNKNKKVAKK
ncbi:UNKNOWN [Stylonychia lemnae]|uniref:GAR domain-containing protein n=1 Tax=Stylonychia lemnae TaxID=5949 RepID=A0A078A665_STYLE|nr:UNKNOWN [Stylonychia lemnae]|eukprot:CDW77745.1 UNKNOWN [Stylonychia lemnae]